MLRNALIALAALILAATQTGAAQAQSGTAAEAKAMLDKAIAAVKTDKTKAQGNRVKMRLTQTA
jgi:hypothetical protein